MTHPSLTVPGEPPAAHELRFESLTHPGRRFAFPCDAVGTVDLATMSEAARASYQRVLALVGREYASPVVVRL
ncbi:MAG: hypothetical protein IIZ92_05950 [Aquincola sp.]|nr:hypothetical protein [Aquincola sp.]